MLHSISRFATLSFVVILIGCIGCQSMQTRTYVLPQGDTSWEAITMVLEEEWQKHSVMSHAKRRGDGVAVKTTSRGHRKITKALETKN